MTEKRLYLDVNSPVVTRHCNADLSSVLAWCCGERILTKTDAGYKRGPRFGVMTDLAAYRKDLGKELLEFGRSYYMTDGTKVTLQQWLEDRGAVILPRSEV